MQAVFQYNVKVRIESLLVDEPISDVSHFSTNYGGIFYLSEKFEPKCS